MSRPRLNNAEQLAAAERAAERMRKYAQELRDLRKKLGIKPAERIPAGISLRDPKSPTLALRMHKGKFMDLIKTELDYEWVFIWGNLSMNFGYDPKNKQWWGKYKEDHWVQCDARDVPEEIVKNQVTIFG